jgi:CDP-glucose 4,6-dehydratase
MKNLTGQRLREMPGPLLLTGHTGFKGTWMTLLLEHLGVPVIGYSLPAEKNSLFERAGRIGEIPEAFADVRDYQALEKFIDSHKPSTVIHMAAQPIVIKSYENPRYTFEVNVMGTVNLLDIAFKKDFIKAIIVVTTDKVYRNDNSGRAFVETDPLEGKDPYSASKVGAESVVAAWQQIAKVSGGPKIVSVRAGNVVGGGDFAENRIIPDLVRGAISGKPVEIRNPISTRPWQHVIELAHGYISTLDAILSGVIVKALNFGPVGLNVDVKKVVAIGQEILPGILVDIPEIEMGFIDIEAKALRLDSTLASDEIQWSCIWNQELSIKKTFHWWLEYLHNRKAASQLCMTEIHGYIELIEQNSGK